METRTPCARWSCPTRSPPSSASSSASTRTWRPRPRTSNRIRGLLTQFHPSPERVLGPRLDHQAVTWLLERYGSPTSLRKAGRRKLVEVIRPNAPHMAKRLIDDVFDALDEQTVVVPGTGTLDVVIPSLARSLGAVHEQRRAGEAQITALLEDQPLSKVLT